MEIDKMVSDLKKVDFSVYMRQRDIKKAMKLIRKNNRKIRFMRIGLAGLALYCVGLAMELAERKRSENYLQEEIEKVGKKVDKTDDDLTELASIIGLNRNVEGKSNDKSDGGSADA